MWCSIRRSIGIGPLASATSTSMWVMFPVTSGFGSRENGTSGYPEGLLTSYPPTVTGFEWHVHSLIWVAGSAGALV